MDRLIRRQREKNILEAAFPQRKHSAQIKEYLFNKFGDKFSPAVGEVVAAWNENSVIEYDKFESGGNGSYMVGGRIYTSIRKLTESEG